MWNPFKRITDIIELVQSPPGEAVAAAEITYANHNAAILAIGPENHKYAKIGYFLLEFEDETLTCVPPKEFLKHYEFTEHIYDSMHMTPVRTIKPL